MDCFKFFCFLFFKSIIIISQWVFTFGGSGSALKSHNNGLLDLKREIQIQIFPSTAFTIEFEHHTSLPLAYMLPHLSPSREEDRERERKRWFVGWFCYCFTPTDTEAY
jgi:hypothetical protein